MTSFMAFIIPKQASLINHFWNEILNEDEDAIKNILTKFQFLPVEMLKFYWKKKKKDDQVALIIGPHFSLQNLVADMGNFWEKLDVSLFDALYGILYGIIMPTLEKLN